MKSIGQDGFPSKSLFIITFMILSLIFSIMIVGVYLSSIHQGYSCKTWPLCPNGFDFPPKEYFYEHFHRFLGLILAISLFSFTAFSVIKLRNRNFSIKLLIASTLLVSQIILGWAVIATKLQPLVVASHLSTGIALFGILVVTLISLQHKMKP
ncbi:Heme A synthase [Candidatus Nitrosocosmicus oleophilus]|uniref:Heme A synthase n=1 Tax=Candidatus Nitrosocosmicus oleophilus TaxID=1353260 RepID=A0A654M2N8_9ARCH|nr:COX15/CtaA family protein [Candidatus Nitrosocosmicus oleophilus]ALI36811.1 Heme A synthase [Candidatus Nitrosocosmicus oleophilus]